MHLDILGYKMIHQNHQKLFHPLIRMTNPSMIEFYLQVSFLRIMIPVMTETDRDAFHDICLRAVEGKLTIEDMGKLDELFHKFDEIRKVGG
jgi:enoyl reductase-like protein